MTVLDKRENSFEWNTFSPHTTFMVPILAVILVIPRQA
jgi:hypothetical protein